MNIKKVAELCNVSVATVSRVINKKGNVKKETEEKILKVIEELNYIPNALARNLSKQESDVIGVVVPDVTNVFYTEVIKGIMESASENNLHVIFYNTDSDMEKEINALKMIKEQRLKGALLISALKKSNKDKKLLKKTLETLDMPLILINKYIDNLPYDGVFTDDIMAGYLLTEALIDNKHSNIAILTGAKNSIVANNRVIGYKNAFKDYNIDIKNENIIYADFNSIENSYKIIKKHFSNKDIPKGIIAGNNNITIACVRYFNERKIKINKDVSLVAFDDIEILNWLGVELTVVSQNPKEMGKEAFNMLFNRINNKSIPINRIHVVPELILRGSEKILK
ncbi:LacI family transcriptional regulator [Hypnocyclicus thermotrophus]|uniref:LacI family transcriptional regulator n=1 Tax=Hypnocyclicus thermotrophus TaxID=1627895 RepID=A0AA46I7E5_9FUSO|nr:LacI family DNA-binding transcriptional regulator [Hypnocyclicus thermotrophus]TDT72458.1 LacI family transcriptional regulator [Hypnocyclicus thermotrophus]